MSKKIYLFSLVLLALAFTACSETEETSRYDNWQARSEAFIDSIANVVYETSPSFLVKKGEESKITYELNLPDTVSAPISKGQQLGTITYYSDGAKLDTVNLISDSTINKISFISMIKHISYNWLNLLRM